VRLEFAQLVLRLRGAECFQREKAFNRRAIVADQAFAELDEDIGGHTVRPVRRGNEAR
jgi:hypothetical protein